MALMPAWSWYGAAGRVYTGLLYTKPSTTPPHARGRGGTTRGSSASQPPVVLRPYPPWVVGAGSGRDSCDKMSRDAVRDRTVGQYDHRRTMALRANTQTTWCKGSFKNGGP
jgi:hypothetical protein